MTNFDKIKAAVDAEVQEAYDRGVAAGLQHFERLHCWLSAGPFCVTALRNAANHEAANIAEKYPRLSHPQPTVDKA